MPFDGKDFALPALVTDEVLRLLTSGRQLLSDPAKWTQGDYCVGDRYCALGALGIRGVVGTDDPRYVAAMCLLEASPQKSVGVVRLNDASSTTHADVLALFDRAIAARRKELQS